MILRFKQFYREKKGLFFLLLISKGTISSEKWLAAKVELFASKNKSKDFFI